MNAQDTTSGRQGADDTKPARPSAAEIADSILNIGSDDLAIGQVLTGHDLRSALIEAARQGAESARPITSADLTGGTGTMLSPTAAEIVAARAFIPAKVIVVRTMGEGYTSTPEVIESDGHLTLSRSLTLAEELRQIQRPFSAETITVYVVDPETGERVAIERSAK